jgi:transcriptional regulator with XRE-family HTH domain
MGARSVGHAPDTAPDTVVDADATVVRIGTRIRTLRSERNLTLQSLAESTGLSSSMLSLVERGKTSPSIGTLVAISSALGVHMTDLFDSRPERFEEPVTRFEDQPVYVTAQGVKRRIAKSDDERGAELVVNEYEPGTGSGPQLLHHSGFEYGLVLEGRLEVEVDGERYQLQPGDCISYDSQLPHRISNNGRKHVTAVWINLDR